MEKFNMAQNQFMGINTPASELMSHSTTRLLSRLSCLEF